MRSALLLELANIPEVKKPAKAKLFQETLRLLVQSEAIVECVILNVFGFKFKSEERKVVVRRVYWALVPWHLLVRAMFLLTILSSCSSAGVNGYNPPRDIVRTSMRAPRPSLHPERKAYRPRLVLRDSNGVRLALKQFLGSRRPFLVDALSRYDQHEPEFVRIFTYYGLPVEISNLAIIESRLVVDARSGSGAVGLWQFMPATARRYGLKVGFLRDQRKDPVLSTVAAAQYLAQLHNRFDDWFLALAAYNCGPSRLARIIKREGTNDFFELAKRKAVSRETRNLVARFIAVTMILRNRSTYGFDEIETEDMS